MCYLVAIPIKDWSKEMYQFAEQFCTLRPDDQHPAVPTFPDNIRFIKRWMEDRDMYHVGFYVPQILLPHTVSDTEWEEACLWNAQAMLDATKNLAEAMKAWNDYLAK